MVFAELVEAGWLGVGVSVHEGTDIISLWFGLLGLLGLEEVGLGGALNEGRRGLAGEGGDVFVEDVVSLLSFQLNRLFP